MTQTLTLADFLLARTAEDEKSWGRMLDDMEYQVVALRALGECEAKRRIVGLHPLEPVRQPDHLIPWPIGGGCALCDHDCNTGGDPTGDGPCATLRALASVYADHSDYREEWRP